MSRLQKIQGCYRSIALVVLNTILLFFIGNLGIWGIMLIRRPFLKFENEIIQRYGEEKLAKAYPQYSVEEMRGLLDEAWMGSQSFSPFVSFKTTPQKGRYFNVNAYGLRDNQAGQEWPPSGENFNIFILGGSTTFGAGLADQETFPAILNRRLKKVDKRVQVYNLGRGGYYSVQELHFLVKLLTHKIVPDLLICFDGLNDFMYFDAESMHEEGFIKATQNKPEKEFLLSKLPMVRVAKKLIGSNQLKRKTREVKVPYRSPWAPEEGESHVEFVVNRYLNTIKHTEQLAHVQGFPVYFVLQPIPMYGFDTKKHLFFGGGWGGFGENREGYRLLHDKVESGEISVDNFVFGADWHKGVAKDGIPLYVDMIHYSAHFCEHIAEKLEVLVREDVMRRINR